MITVFCNVYINSLEKLSLFKDTFKNVFPISDNWLINIRGKYKDQVIKQIKKIPGNNRQCTFFQNLNDDDWAESAREMIKDAKYDHIYIYLEDHFLQQPLSHFRNVINDAIRIQTDFIPYSFFDIGMSTKSVEIYNPTTSRYFETFILTPELLPLIRSFNPNFYPISLVGIYSKTLLIKVLKAEDKKKLLVHPYIQLFMQNVLFTYPRNRRLIFFLNKVLQIYRLVLNTPKSPMNIERSIHDIELSLLPIKISILKQELFANWDDDNGSLNLSLIKRGLYPKKLLCTDKNNNNSGAKLSRVLNLSKGGCYSAQYHPEIGRIVNIPKKEISVIQGSLIIEGMGERYIANSGKKMNIYANIPHKITARKITKYRSSIYF